VAERDEALVIRSIVEKATDQGVSMIVVGLPRPLSGGSNSQVAGVLQFVERLRTATSIPVRTWDERFTSKMAREGRPGRGPDDAVAACYMLQNFLDAHGESGGDRRN
jgi:RNase H-fold protein (predicted Holliday junction resolvase)